MTTAARVTARRSWPARSSRPASTATATRARASAPRARKAAGQASTKGTATKTWTTMATPIPRTARTVRSTEARWHAALPGHREDLGDRKGARVGDGRRHDHQPYADRQGRAQVPRGGRRDRAAGAGAGERRGAGDRVRRDHEGGPHPRRARRQRDRQGAADA